MQLTTYLSVVILNAFLLVNLASAQPSLSKSQAQTLIKNDMQYERLYWTPFPLPYELPQASTSKDAKLLAALAKHNLVSREAVKVAVAVHNGKPQYEQRWLYNYQPLRQAYDREGFYYGKPKLLRIAQLSEPSTAKGKVFVLVRIEWMVDDLQHWITDPAFKIARTLRRSQHSARQPFEKKIYFEYLPESESWQQWSPNN